MHEMLDRLREFLRQRPQQIQGVQTARGRTSLDTTALIAFTEWLDRHGSTPLQRVRARRMRAELRARYPDHPSNR